MPSMRPRDRAQLTVPAAVGACLLAAVATAQPAPETVRNFAVEALRLEMQLVPLLGPERAGSPEFAATVRRLAAVDADGERLLRQLIDAGLRPGPTLTRTLRRLPPPQAGQPLPTVNDYRDAIAELQAWRPGEAPIATPPAMPAAPPGAPVAASPATPGPAPAPRPPAVPARPLAPSVSVTYESPGGTRRIPLNAAIVVAAGVVSILSMAGIIHLLSRRRPRDLAAIAMTDALTGAGNRHKFDLDREGLSNGPLTRLSIVMIDIDHFKEVNDRYGHLTGDDVLRRVGRVLTAQVRPQDQVYRYGGEEFCAVLRNASFAEARRVADRLCAAVALTRMPTDRPVTVSVGLAAGPSSQIETILRRADAALYEAKRSGRNRVVTHEIAASTPYVERRTKAL